MRSAVLRLVAVVVALTGGLLPAAPAGSEPADTGGAVPGVTAAGYQTRYLVPPNPLNITDGVVLDGKGSLYICLALVNRVVRLDLATGELTVIAAEFDAEPFVPDDITMGPDGNLYVTDLLGRSVIRMSPDGKDRQVVGSNVGDGSSLANAVAFNAEGRLFATDLSFSDPSHPGGLWEIDPAGVKPAVPVIRPMPAPNGFAFGPDGLAYIPQMWAGRIDVVDVDARTVRTLVDGFGYLVSVRMDPQSNLVVLETDTGTVWRVDRSSGARTFLARGEPGLDNAVVHPDGEIWVTNFNRGGLRRVNVATGTLDPVVPDRPLTLPFSLSEAPDGSIVVGDFTSVNRVRDGQSTRLSRLLNPDNLQLLSPGAVQIGSDVYLSDLLPPKGRLFRLDTKTGKRHQVASGFGLPWTVREGAGGRLLVGDQALGAVFEVDPATGSTTPLVQGLTSPSGLAFDRSRGLVYVSDTGGGRVLAVDLASRMPSVVASGLDGPEGVAVDRDGSLLVVEGDAGRLVRIGPGGGGPTVLATGLPTQTVGFGLPLMNYSADVLVRSDGSIVVSGPADASLIELRHSQEDLARARTAGMGDGGEAVGQRVAGVDQGTDGHPLLLQGPQGRGEQAAAGADHPHLVDHQRSQGERVVLGHRGLEHQGAPGTDGGHGLGETGGGPGGLDHHVRLGSGAPLGGQDATDAEAADDVQLGVVPAHHGHCRTCEVEHLRAEQPELPIAQDHSAGTGRQVDLLEDGVRGGQRLGENRLLVGHPLRHEVKVLGRYGDIVGEGAVGAQDPHDGAVRAVAPKPLAAQRAGPAGEVDFTHHPPVRQMGGPLAHLPHELVPGHAHEAHVTLEDLKVGGADPGQSNPYHRHARGRLRGGMVPGEPQLLAVPVQGPHRASVHHRAGPGRRKFPARRSAGLQASWPCRGSTTSHLSC